MNRSKSSNTFHVSSYLDFQPNQDNEDNNIRQSILDKHQSLYSCRNECYNDGWMKILELKDQLSAREKLHRRKSKAYDNQEGYQCLSGEGQLGQSEHFKQVTDSKIFKQVLQLQQLQNNEKNTLDKYEILTYTSDPDKNNKNKNKYQNKDSNHAPHNYHKNKQKNYKKNKGKYQLHSMGKNSKEFLLGNFHSMETSNTLNNGDELRLGLHKLPSLQTNPSTPKNQQLVVNLEQYAEQNLGYEAKPNLSKRVVQCPLNEPAAQQRKNQVSKKQWIDLKMKTRSLQNSLSILKKQKKLYTMKLLQYQIQIDKLLYELELQRRPEAKVVLCPNCQNTNPNFSNTNHTNSNSINSNSHIKNPFQVSNLSCNNSSNNSCQYPAITVQELEILKQNLSEEKQAKEIANKQRDILINELNQTLCNHQNQLSSVRDQLKESFKKLSQYERQSRSLHQLHQEQTLQLANLNTKIETSQQNIRYLAQNIVQLSHKLEQSVSTSYSLEQQANRLNNQLNTLNEQSDILVQTLQNVRFELNMEKGRCVGLQKVIKDKEKSIEELGKEICQYRAKLQDFLVDTLQVKTIFNRYEDRIFQLQAILRTKDQNIESLYQNIDRLSESMQQIKKNHSFKSNSLQNEHHSLLQSLSILEEQQKAHHKYLEEAYCLLKIPLSNPTTPYPNLYPEQPILSQIEALLQHNRYNCQIVGDYRQILEMFNISYQDELYHQKLLMEISQFRNNIGNLVKKLRIMQKKINVLTDLNNKYMNIIQNGCKESVQQLERLVQEQNQEIMKYRLHLHNITLVQHQIREI